MNDYHSRMDTTTLPRLTTANLADRLRVMPAVVVTGARQTGKSTLIGAGVIDMTKGNIRYARGHNYDQTCHGEYRRPASSS